MLTGLSSVDVLAFALTRTCSVSPSILGDLDLHALAVEVDELDRRSQALARERVMLCDWLHGLIGARRKAGCDARAWVALRRDLYNDRNRLERADVASFSDWGEGDRVRWHGFIRERAALRGDALRFEKRLAAELQTTLPAALCRAFEIGVWTEGLALSSMALAREVQQYGARSSHPRRRRNTVAELGGLRYLARACTKTSPFGAFTQVASVCLEPEHVGSAGQACRDQGPNAFVRVNPHLLGWVERRLRSVSPVVSGLGLRVNASLRVSEGRALWATFDPRYSALRSMVAAPWFGTWCASDRAGVVLSGEQLLGELVPFVERAEAETMLERMLDSGLLELDLGVPVESQTWEVLLARFLLEQSTTASAREVAKRLFALGELRGRFTSSGGHERLALLEQAFDVLGELDEVLEPGARTHQVAPAPTLKREMVFTEDRVRPGSPEYKPLPPALRRALTTLADVWPDQPATRAEQWLHLACLAHGATLPFMAAYDQLCRSHARDELEALLVPSSLEAVRRFESLLGARLSERAQEVHITGAELQDLGMARPGMRSTTFMLMPPNGADGADAPWVVDRVHAGWGGLFTRYLHALDPSVTDALGRHMRCDDAQTVVAELADGSLSPTNHGPPLCAHELLLPRARGRLPLSSRIRVGDLQLMVDGGRLHLGLPNDGRRVVPVDTGLALAGRSHLFRCLRVLGAPEPWPLEWLASAVFACVARRAGEWSILELPRLVFAESLVLQRRRWLVRPEGLRDLDASNTARAFISARAFRARHGLPESVFVRGGQFEEAQRGLSVRQDDYKPQFISFRNPLSCRQFATLAHNATSVLELAECLPAVHVTQGAHPPQEFVVQCSNQR